MSISSVAFVQLVRKLVSFEKSKAAFHSMSPLISRKIFFTTSLIPSSGTSALTVPPSRMTWRDRGWIPTGIAEVRVGSGKAETTSGRRRTTAGVADV
uniref:Uncharacterized protein n=1 Tax=Arundo donax TaxID=35708 RepID=A0A0A9FMF2_ARUDO